MLQSSYYAPIQGFLNQPDTAILASMTRISKSVIFQQEPSQYREDWQKKIQLLQSALPELKSCLSWDDWFILLETALPWTVTLVDTILITHDLLIIIQFHFYQSDHREEDIVQLQELCWTLARHHPIVKGHLIIPILYCPRAPSRGAPRCYLDQPIQPVFFTNQETLTQTLGYIVASYAGSKHPFQPEKILETPFSFSPSFIQGVASIFASNFLHASHLSITSHQTENTNFQIQLLSSLLNELQHPHPPSSKRLFIVHGEPGSGKTFLSLHLATSLPHAVYLHPSSKFVHVLQQIGKEIFYPTPRGYFKISSAQLRECIKSLYQFFDQHYGPELQSAAHTVIIDDAQNCWDTASFRERYLFYNHEAEMLLTILERNAHRPLSIVIFLSPEQSLTPLVPYQLPWLAGIEFAVKRGWEVFVPETYKDWITFDQVKFCSWLDLNRNLRSEDHPNYNVYLDYLFTGKCSSSNLPPISHGNRLLITRSLSGAIEWVRKQKMGYDRIALLHTSTSARLIASGLPGTKVSNLAKWYLTPPLELGSCSCLEHTATEKECVSLQFEWVILAWDLDLRHDGANWQPALWANKKWNVPSLQDPVLLRMMLNRYRNLLTRASLGTIIWLPPGDPDDPSRRPVFYDATVHYLQQSGIPSI